MLSKISESKKSTILIAFKLVEDVRNFVNTETGLNFKYKDIDNLPLFGKVKTKNAIIMSITSQGPLYIITPIGILYLIGISSKRIMIMTDSLLEKLISRYNLKKIIGKSSYNNSWLVNNFDGVKLPTDTTTSKINNKSHWLSYFRIWKKLRKI